MASNHRSRRGFLKHGAALAGLAIGGVPSVDAQTPTSPSSDPMEMKKASKELVAYGERSRYVTSVRVPVAERMSPASLRHTPHQTAEPFNTISLMPFFPSGS